MLTTCQALPRRFLWVHLFNPHNDLEGKTVFSPFDASGSLCPETDSLAWTHTAAREEPGFEPSPSGPGVAFQPGSVLQIECVFSRFTIRTGFSLLSLQRQPFPMPGDISCLTQRGHSWDLVGRSWALLAPYSAQHSGVFALTGQWCRSRCPGHGAVPAACLGRTFSVVLPMRDTQQRPVSTPGWVCLWAGPRFRRTVAVSQGPRAGRS